MSYLRAWRLSVGQPLVALTRGSFKRKDKSPKGTKADKGRSAGDDRRFTQQALLMKRDKPPRRSPEQLQRDKELVQDYARMRLRQSHIETADWRRKFLMRDAALDALPVDLRAMALVEVEAPVPRIVHEYPVIVRRAK